MKRIIQAECINFEVDSDKDSIGGQWTVEVEFEAHTEDNWGADADGNRGIERTFIDDYEVTRYLDSEGKEVQADKLPKIVKEVADKTIEDWDGDISSCD